VGPPVASIAISPENPSVDIGDTLTLRATPRSATGAPLTGVDVTWRSNSPILMIEPTGRVRGVTPGFAEVEAEAWNGVTGRTNVRVTPVTGLAPDTGRYGALMTIQGAGFPAGISRVEFTAASGSGRVPAFIRSASETAIEVWVPAEAGSGPIWVTGGADSFQTSRRFGITADDDIFEGADCGGAICVYVVPVPYQNPSLLAALNDTDLIGFELENPSPISIHVVDRGARNGTDVMAAFVVRAEPQPVAVAGQVLTADLVQRVYVDSVVYSHSNLPPGLYFVEVFGLSLQGGGSVRRAYGLTITTTAQFDIPPDAFEPNDWPTAAGSRVTLPFDRADLAAENPWSIDNYVFDVAVASEITATVTGAGGDLDLFLIAGDTVDWSGALGPTPHPAILDVGWTPGSSEETVRATVQPGRYNVVVQEFGGQATTYRLQITATPVSSAGPFTLSAPVPTAPAARWLPPSAERLTPRAIVPVRVPPR